MDDTEQMGEQPEGNPNRIDEAIASAGYNRREAAALMGYTPQRMWNWAHGLRDPDARDVAKMARFLGVSPSYLLGDDPCDLVEVLGPSGEPTSGRAYVPADLYGAHERLVWQECPGMPGFGVPKGSLVLLAMGEEPPLWRPGVFRHADGTVLGHLADLGGSTFLVEDGDSAGLGAPLCPWPCEGWTAVASIVYYRPALDWLDSRRPI